MRILFVLEYYPPYIGGVETLFYNLITSLKDKGHEIKIITTRHPDRDVLAYPEVLEVPTQSRMSFILFALKHIWREAKRYDLVHSSSYTAGFIAQQVCKRLKKPVIITFHEFWGDLWRVLPGLSSIERRLYLNFEKRLAKGTFDAVVAVSQHTERELLKAGVEKTSLHMIYNGIDYSDRNKKPLNYVDVGSSEELVFRLLFYGRCGNSKGLDILVSAMEHLENDESIRLDIVTNLEQNRLGRSVKARIKNLERTVSHHSQLPYEELREIINKSHAVVIPSYAEGFCFVAVESQAEGKGVIHSGRGALSEVVSGKFVKYEGQTPEALCDAIIKAKKGEWSYSQKRTFPLEETIDKYIELYQKILTK